MRIYTIGNYLLEKNVDLTYCMRKFKINLVADYHNIVHTPPNAFYQKIDLQFMDVEILWAYVLLSKIFAKKKNILRARSEGALSQILKGD